MYKGAGIALFKKGTDDYAILVGKRTIRPFKHKWSIFGGKSESYDKTSFETAKREFREESRFDFSTINANSHGECHFNLIFFKWTTFLYEVDDSFLPPNHFSYEFSELKFILLHEINNYKLAFGVRKEIRIFLKNCKNKNKKHQPQLELAFM